MTERAKDRTSIPSTISRCPDCGHTDLNITSDSEYITIAKCPKCGRLLAPVKKH